MRFRQTADQSDQMISPANSASNDASPQGPELKLIALRASADVRDQTYSLERYLIYTKASKRAAKNAIDPTATTRAPSASLSSAEWRAGANKPPRYMAMSAGGILSHDLFAQYKLKDFSDVSISLKDGQEPISAHRCILAVRSEYLRKILTEYAADATNGLIQQVLEFPVRIFFFEF